MQNKITLKLNFRIRLVSEQNKPIRIRTNLTLVMWERTDCVRIGAWVHLKLLEYGLLGSF